MDQASEQGLILIEGSGPTYATSTVRNTIGNTDFYYVPAIVN